MGVFALGLQLMKGQVDYSLLVPVIGMLGVGISFRILHLAYQQMKHMAGVDDEC